MGEQRRRRRRRKKKDFEAAMKWVFMFCMKQLVDSN